MKKILTKPLAAFIKGLLVVLQSSSLIKPYTISEWQGLALNPDVVAGAAGVGLGRGRGGVQRKCPKYAYNG